MSSDYFFKKVLLKTAFLLTKCIICPKTRLWLSRLFNSAFQPKVNRMLCLIFPIFLHLQSYHTASSLIAPGKSGWSHIHVVTPRKKPLLLALSTESTGERVKIKKKPTFVHWTLTWGITETWHPWEQIVGRGLSRENVGSRKVPTWKIPSKALMKGQGRFNVGGSCLLEGTR